MFDKVKQGKKLLQLRSQAKDLQKKLEEVEHSEESGGIRVKVNGAQEVIYLEIDGSERSDVVDVINKAVKGVQKKAAKKMMEEGGGLGGLLGGMG
ncbi:YbaB/EbfC family nucleoid-associated protein [Patescibacteria group bacterium]|nr:YbaB/EbfC family nucleoid-associated protein [Patescibacteria group bacterium]